MDYFYYNGSVARKQFDAEMLHVVSEKENIKKASYVLKLCYDWRRHKEPVTKIPLNICENYRNSGEVHYSRTVIQLAQTCLSFMLLKLSPLSQREQFNMFYVKENPVKVCKTGV
jgi:hypothetical protein